MKYGLSLGCGREFKESTPEIEWTNVDADRNVRADIYVDVEELRTDLRFDEIVAKDILEHIPHRAGGRPGWFKALEYWVECLKQGGTIFIQAPDMHSIVHRLEIGAIDEETANRVIYGESTNELDRHYQLFSLDRLKTVVLALGLEIVEAYNLHVCAIVVGRKPL